MKREYFAPKAELCEIKLVAQILAGSTETGVEGGDMTRERKGDWDNIWGN